MSKLLKQTGDRRGEARALQTHRLSQVNTAHKQSVQLGTWSKTVQFKTFQHVHGTVYSPVCLKGEKNMALRPHGQRPVYRSARV